MVSKSKAVREILFRGKENPSGKWVEGFLVGHCHIGDWVSCTPIHSKTVGQFTGLTDKNGKKIFEGDICKTIVCDMSVQKNVGVIGYDSLGMLGLKNADDVWNDFFIHVDIGCVESYSIEIIGNIHDNPELLEGCDG